MTILTRFVTGAVAALALSLPAGATEYRIAVGDGAGGTQEALGLAFIEALEQESGGEMTGKLFLNGQLGDERMTLEGQPELREGEQVFLLVLDDEVQCPFVGIWQGVYKVVDGRVVREGRPVVDVVEGDAVLAQDQGIGMTARAFAGELKRLVGRAPGVDLDAVEVAVEHGRKTISLRAPGSQLDPHGHPNGAHELRPTQPQGSATGPEVLR